MNKISLIAGIGDLPVKFLEEAAKNNYEVFPVYLFDEVEEIIKNHPNAIKYSIGQVGKIISHIKKSGCTKTIMLGKVEKKVLFSNLKLDLAATGILLKTVNNKDESILLQIIKYIESKGIEVMPQNYLLEKYMSKDILYTKRDINSKDNETIKIGIEASKALTKIDAGQTVVVKDGSVVALEGIEGTDKTIERAGNYAGKNCIIVKSARPNQDFRIDIPTIGLNTIKKIIEIDAKGIIIEADKMLFINREEVVQLANKNNIFIKGLKYE